MDNNGNESWYASQTATETASSEPVKKSAYLKSADKTIKIIGTIAAALYAMMILFRGMSTVNILVIAAFVLFAVSFYPAKKNLLVIIGSALYLVAILYNGGYSVGTMIAYHEGLNGSMIMTLIGIVVQLAGIVLLLLMAVSIYKKNYSKADKYYRIWFLPGILVPVSIIMRDFSYALNLRVLILTVAILFVGYDIFKPEISEYESEPEYKAADTDKKGNKTYSKDPKAIEKLERAHKLYEANEISEEEYNKLKSKYMSRI